MVENNTSPFQTAFTISTEGGIVLRTNISDIRLISRNTTGVKLMTTADGDQVASIAVLDQKE